MQLFLTDPATIEAIREVLARAPQPLHILQAVTTLVIVDPKEYFKHTE
jgi:hypothetical protein